MWMAEGHDYLGRLPRCFKIAHIIPDRMSGSEVWKAWWHQLSQFIMGWRRRAAVVQRLRLFWSRRSDRSGAEEAKRRGWGQWEGCRQAQTKGLIGTLAVRSLAEPAIRPAVAGRGWRPPDGGCVAAARDFAVEGIQPCLCSVAWAKSCILSSMWRICKLFLIHDLRTFHMLDVQ